MPDPLPDADGCSVQGEIISPQALAELMRQQPVRLIDVRTPAEFVRVHAEGAVNIPLHQLDPAKLEGNAEASYVICRAGSRSREAIQRIRTVTPGRRTVLVEGGTLAWIDAGLAVVRTKPKKKRRTSRYVLASVMVVSALLATFVHPGLVGFMGLAAAYIVAEATLHPRHWLWLDEPDVTEAKPG